jgi:molybdate transport repressor ModE-like protein
MLDVRRLHVLREVASRGSFSAAADELFLSQSAVSQQVAALEREVGMPLLERTREGPVLTDAGRALVGHADAVIARLDEAERELQAIAGLEGGELRIASFASASATIVTEAAAEFTKRHPKVRISLSEAEPEESVPPRLRAGELDLALVLDYPIVPEEAHRDLELTLLLTESMHLVLPRDHRLAERRSVRLTDLADEPWLSGVAPSSCREVVVRACEAAGFEPQISYESDDYAVLQGLVAAGLGVTFLPDLALPTMRSDLVVVPTKPKAPERRIWAATRSAGSCSPATDAMVAILGDVSSSFIARGARAAA